MRNLRFWLRKVGTDSIRIPEEDAEGSLIMRPSAVRTRVALVLAAFKRAVNGARGLAEPASGRNSSVRLHGAVACLRNPETDGRLPGDGGARRNLVRVVDEIDIKFVPVPVGTELSNSSVQCSSELSRITSGAVDHHSNSRMSSSGTPAVNSSKEEDLPYSS